MRKLLILCLLTSSPAFAQTPPIDSLKRALALLERQPESRERDTKVYGYLEWLTQAYADVQIDSALQYNSRRIQLCTRNQFETSLVKAYIYQGYLNRVKGADFEGIRWLYKALLLAEKRKDNPQVAYICYSLAHSYFNLNQYKKSLALCERGMALLKKYPNADTEMNILNIYGANYKEYKKYQMALQQYQRLYRLAHTHKNVWFEAQSRHETGWVFQAMNQTDSATVAYRNALLLAHQTGSLDLESSIELNLIGLLMQQQKWPEALKLGFNVRRQSMVMQNTSTLLETQEKLYKIYKALGEPVNSLTAYEQYVTLKDSLSKETNANRIETLQAQYNNVQNEIVLKKQQVQLLSEQNNNQRLAQTRNSLFAGIFTILLVAGLLLWNNRRLQSKNRQISRQSVLLETARTQLADINQTLEIRVAERTKALLEANAELIRKNEEIKGALFKGQTIERKRVALELHDNLSSLLSALNMSIQGINPAGLSEKEQRVYQNIRQMMTNAYAEVRNISHNILPADLEQQGLIKVLTGLVTKLNQNTPIQFTLHSTLSTERLPAEIEFNLYSIMLELVNNVIRHAQATEASLQISQATGSIHLCIADNGRGFSPVSQAGVGLQNIQSRLDAIGGTFQVTRHEPVGTKIDIQIPVDVLMPTGNLDAV